MSNERDDQALASAIIADMGITDPAQVSAARMIIVEHTNHLVGLQYRLHMTQDELQETQNQLRNTQDQLRETRIQVDTLMRLLTIKYPRDD